MTATGRSAGSAPESSDGSGNRRRDATSLLTVLVLLMLLLPSRFVVGALGGAGAPAMLLGVALLGLWMLSRASDSVSAGRGRQPIRVAIAFLVLAALASYATGMLIGFISPIGIKPPLGAPLGHVPAPSPLRGFVPTEISAADRGLLTLAGLIGIAAFAADGIRDRQRLDLLLQRLVLVAAIVAAIGIVQFFTTLDVSKYLKVPGLRLNADFGFVRSRGAYNRAASTAIDPIEFSVVMGAMLPIALHYAFYAPVGRRLVRAALAGMIAASIPMAVSRSGVLVAGVAIVVMFLGGGRRQRATLLAAMPVLLVAIHAAVPGLIGTFSSLFTHVSNDPSAVARTARYPMALHVISQSPFTGRGMSTFIGGYYTPMDNQFFLTAIEMGVLGLLALIGLFAVAFCTARGVRRRAQDEATRDLGQALAAAVAGLFAGYATFDAFSFPMCAMVTFFLIGVTGALWRIEWQPRPRASTPHAQPVQAMA